MLTRRGGTYRGAAVAVMSPSRCKTDGYWRCCRRVDARPIVVGVGGVVAEPLSNRWPIAAW